MKKAQVTESDVLVIIYRPTDSITYGAIQFFKLMSGVESVNPYMTSSPFVVSERIGSNEVIYGSGMRLVEEVTRLCASVDQLISELNVKLRHVTSTAVTAGERGRIAQLPEGDHASARIHYEFRQHLTGTLVHLSAQARNLFDTFPRLSGSIPLSDADGERTRDIALRDLFNEFVHYRYLFLDGEYVSDFFTYRPTSRAPITKTFMGYRFNWIGYVDAIRRAAHDVRLKDLTGLLRRGLQRLSLKSSYDDIVFLIQNLHSFSRLFALKVPDERYRSMLNLMFDSVAVAYQKRVACLIPRDQDAEQLIVFRAPWIAIKPRLSEQMFDVRVDCRCELHDQEGRVLHQETDFERATISVYYKDLLHIVERDFGDDRLLGFRP